MRPPRPRRSPPALDPETLGRSTSVEVDDEIRFHIETRTEQLVQAGMSRVDAESQAWSEFGPVSEVWSDAVRSMEGRRRRATWLALLTDSLQDLVYALRSFRSRPGPILVAILSIAVGIGAVSTIWTLVDRLVLRPLPFDPDRALVYVGTSTQQSGGASFPTAPGDFLDLSRDLRTADLAAYQEGGANLGGEIPEWVGFRRVASMFFDVLGVAPTIGRGFGEGDYSGEESAVALLDYGLWERRFARDPEVLGTTITLDGQPYTVVGVLPRGFEFGNGTVDIWLPLVVRDDGVRVARTLTVVGRLRGTLAATRAELAERARGLAERFPETHADRRFPVNEVVAELSGGPTGNQGMGASLTAAILVLLVACVNIANLLLARGAERAEDYALLRALGATRSRIARRLFAEPLLLGAAGGALGIGLSFLGVRGLVAIIPPHIARRGELAVDARIIAVGIGVTLAAVVLCGALPAVHTVAAAEKRRMISRTPTATSRRGSRLRATLVTAQVGLAVILVTTTALVVRTFEDLVTTDTGFTTDNVWTFQVDLPETAYPDEQAMRRGYEELREALTRVPGVSAVGLGIGVPARSWRTLRYSSGGAESPQPRVLTRIADPEYARVLGVAPVVGRSFSPEDDGDSRAVALVNESFAAAVWAEREPIGEVLQVEGRELEIVGVVPDKLEAGPTDPVRHVLYAPLAQWPSRTVSVVLESSAAEPPLGGIRSAVSGLAGGVAVRDFLAFEAVLIQSADIIRAMARVLSVMAAGALLLALCGIYAATSYGVASRSRELGLRMALGANPVALRAGVLGRVLLGSLVGLALGLPVAWGMGQALSMFVLGSAGSAPGTYVGVTLALLAVSAFAAWEPARRVASIDPADAMRAE